MNAQCRAQDAEAGLAPGIDEHTGAGAVSRLDAARGVGAADRGRERALSDDLAHDRGLVQIAAWGGQQDDVAGCEIGLVQSVAEQRSGGGADRAADEECAAALRSTVEVDLVDQRKSQARRDVLVFPVVPGLGLRQVPVGANADAGDQQDEDGDRPEMPPAPGRLHWRCRWLTGRYARRRDRWARRRPAETVFSTLSIFGRQSVLVAGRPFGVGLARRIILICRRYGAMPSDVATCFNERRRCAWSQPAWRRACRWPVRELNPSRLRVTPH